MCVISSENILHTLLFFYFSFMVNLEFCTTTITTTATPNDIEIPQYFPNSIREFDELKVLYSIFVLWQCVCFCICFVFYFFSFQKRYFRSVFTPCCLFLSRTATITECKDLWGGGGVCAAISDQVRSHWQISIPSPLSSTPLCLQKVTLHARQFQSSN